MSAPACCADHPPRVWLHPTPHRHCRVLALLATVCVLHPICFPDYTFKRDLRAHCGTPLHVGNSLLDGWWCVILSSIGGIVSADDVGEILAAAGKTSELLGFELGTTRFCGGRNCATAAAPAEKGKIAATMILALCAI